MQFPLKPASNNKKPRGHSFLHAVSVGTAIFMIVGAWGVFTVVRAQGLWHELKNSSASASEMRTSFSEETARLKDSLKDKTESITKEPDTENDKQQIAEEEKKEESVKIDQTNWIKTVLTPIEEAQETEQVESSDNVQLSSPEPSLTEVQSQ